MSDTYRNFRLDPFQSEAIQHIQNGRSVLVSAPTGTGKTLIADYLIEHVLEEGGEIIYTAPIKALSNQKYREYSRLVGAENVGLMTGDIVINRDAPVRIMTTEILRNMLLHADFALEATMDEAERKEWEETAPPSQLVIGDMSNLRAVIVDEIHFIDDADRGTVWEELLIYLPAEIRILGLSATLSNLEEFSEWLSHIRGQKVEVVTEYTRHVPLKIQAFNQEAGFIPTENFEKEVRRWRRGKGNAKKESRGRGRGRGRQRERRTQHVEVFAAMDKTMFPALYFIYSRKLTEERAFALARSQTGRQIARKARRAEIDVVLDDFRQRFDQVLTDRLARLYQSGIAFHHAGLHVALKSLVEELYEKRLVNVLYCTSTFALGINMPARTVVFDSLTRFDGTDFVGLSTREFMQMAGRAGRRGIDAEGDVLIRLDFTDFEESKETLRSVLESRSEPVTSSFNLSFHSVVSLVERFEEGEIQKLLAKSFRTFQDNQNAERLAVEIEAMAGRRGSDRRIEARYWTAQRELVEARRPSMWEQFQRKVMFLRTVGYLDRKNSLNAAARILRKIQFTEIYLTELVMDGLLDDLDAETIFGMMCGLVQSLPRTAKVRRPPERWLPIFDRITSIRNSEVVTGSELVSSTDLTFTPALMPLGQMWARGESLSKILEEVSNPTDLSGDLVGAFRRAKDLIGQLRSVYEDDEPRRKEFTRVLRNVTRDEVEVID